MSKVIEQFTQIGDIGAIYGGKTLDRNLTIEEALREGGLSWSVGLKCLFMDNSVNLATVVDGKKTYRMCQEISLNLATEDSDPDEQYTEVPDAYATYRNDTNKPLGVVGNRYVPVQNRDAFGWVERFLGKDIEYISTAGSLFGGRKTFVCLDMGGFNVVDGDEVRRHLLVTNSHDGSSNVVVNILGARIQCKNALNFSGMADAASYKVKHSASAAQILEEISQVWAGVKEGFLRMEDIFGEMAQTKISSEKHNRIIKKALGISDAAYDKYQDERDTAARPRWYTPYEEIIQVGEQAPGSQTAPGTVWATYNAITGYYDHMRIVRGKDPTVKLDSKLFGFDAKQKEDALALCVNALNEGYLSDFE